MKRTKLVPLLVTLLLFSCTSSQVLEPEGREVASVTWKFMDLPESSSSRAPALLVDKNNTPHVLYDSFGTVRYAKYVNGEWIHELVEDDCGDRCQSMKLYEDVWGNIHVLYEGSGEGESLLYYGERRVEGWEVEIADSDAYSGLYASLAFDEFNNIHLSNATGLPYYDLRHKERVDGKWVSTAVDTEGETGYSNFITVRDGDPWILYRDSPFTSFYSMWRREGEWIREPFDPQGMIPRSYHHDRAGNLFAVGESNEGEEPGLYYARVDEHELIRRSRISESALDASIDQASDGTFWAAYGRLPMHISRELHGGSWERWVVPEDSPYVTGLRMAMSTSDRIFVVYVRAGDRDAVGTTRFAEMIVEYND